MPDTSNLYSQADDAETELASLDLHTAEAKEQMRSALYKLASWANTTDRDEERAFNAIFEAVDDFVSETREAIRARVTEADEEISRIEERDLRGQAR